jgi:AIR synthase-related protein
MKLEPGRLPKLTAELRARVELDAKRDIQVAARAFGRTTRSSWFPGSGAIVNGDDAAALATEDGYTLFAAEGMRADFIARDPWFSGYCSVLVNVNDIAAMGGRPWAIVDVLFLGDGGADRVLEGMSAASEALGVPIVGGHTGRVEGPTQLAAAVLGRAKRLIAGDGARPGHVLVAAVDLKGTFRGAGGNFNAATSASPKALRAQLAVLPELAEARLVTAGRDISMAGTCGTLAMLLEASGTGAVLDVERVPAPADVDLLRWLGAFPSFGFVLAVEERHVAAVCGRFDAVGVASAAIGEVTEGRRLELRAGNERALYFDLEQAPLTGFGC